MYPQAYALLLNNVMLTQVVKCTILHIYAVLYNHIYWIVSIKQNNLCINIFYVLTVVMLLQGHCKLLLSSIASYAIAHNQDI